MTRHHAMVTYWRDTAQPSNTRGLTVADDDPVVVQQGIRDALARFMRDQEPMPLFPGLAPEFWEEDDPTDDAA